MTHPSDPGRPPAVGSAEPSGSAEDATRFEDIAGLSFEAAMAELEAIVRKLEGGQGALEESVRDYERGSRLRAHCAGKLREAQLTIERIHQAADGSLEGRPDPTPPPESGS